MGDGKTFEQALRALDKLIAEQMQDAESDRAEPEPAAAGAVSAER